MPIPLNYGLGGNGLPLEYGLKPGGSSSDEVPKAGGIQLDYGLNLSKTKAGIEELPFEAKHPNVYGAWGAVKETAKELVPYIKYIDPDERERFWKLSKQKQVRELLLQDLELVTLGKSKAIATDIKYGTKVLGKALPKTAEKLSKINRFGKDVPTKTPITEPSLVPETPEVPKFTELVKTDTQAIPAPKQTASQKVVEAIKEAKPIRAEQEAIYTKVRAEKIGKAIAAGQSVPGEAGYYAKLSKMSGKMDRVQYQSIREKVGQADIDDLFTQLNDSTAIGEFEKLSAGNGLAKMFGEFGGSVPTNKQLELLGKVYGNDFVKATLSKRSLFQKAKDAGLEIANIPRALMASFDVSAPLRQGVFLVGRPKQFMPAAKEMFKYLFSEKSYKTLMDGIAKRPSYQLMKDSGLSLTEMGQTLATREEKFMSSWAERIPVVGRGVRASGRAYTGFLNKLRADVFDDIAKKGSDIGIKDPKFFKDAANFVNHATGRGTLGQLEKSAVALNATFFSPRLMASRLNLINPAFYAKLHPQARKEAIKSLFTFATTASTVAGLATLNGASVGTDPRSADFMKLKFGNTRYDVLGGFQQPIRAAAQLISGQIVSSTTGKVMTLGEGYKPLTRTDIVSRFLESKEAPVVSFATALLRGQTSLGEKVDIPTEVANRFVPMVIQDMSDLYKEKGNMGIAMAAPAFFGVGVMSYGGVNSYGLNGKDYPKLNTELSRLKTSMGFPSQSAFGQELTLKEYKALKVSTGNEIAKRLTAFISTKGYKEMEDNGKIKNIEQHVDLIKEDIKIKMFPNKKIKSDIISSLIEGGMSREEAKVKSDELIKNRRLMVK